MESQQIAVCGDAQGSSDEESSDEDTPPIPHSFPSAVLATSDGSRLYVCDHGLNQLLTCAVGPASTARNNLPKCSVVCALPRPRALVWEQYAPTGPNTVLYAAVQGGIACVNVQNGACATVLRLEAATASSDGSFSDGADLYGLAFTPSGWLLFSCRQTNALYAVEPDTGVWCRVAGGGSGAAAEAFRASAMARVYGPSPEPLPLTKRFATLPTAVSLQNSGGFVDGSVKHCCALL